MAQQNKRIQPGDILTPANFLTAFGLGLVIYGSMHLATRTGVILLFAGRLFDLIDGPVARRTHSSRFGALFDATSDKIAMLALLIASWHFHTAPHWVVLFIAGHNIISATLSTITELRHGDADVTATGKHAVFLQNVVLVLFAVAHLAGSVLLEDVSSIITVISIVWAVAALQGYASRLVKSGKK